MAELQMNVLIADDEPGMRLILRKKIEKTEGFTLVGEAVNGEEAVSLFQELHPQVVFLDVDMPKRNGIECARAIQDMNPAAIIIFATAHEEYRQEAFEVYAFDYLVKPFNLERLEQTLERILKTRNPSEGNPLPKPATVKPVEGRLMLKHKDGIAFIDQQDILLDYLGVGIEIHLRMLERCIETE